MEKKDLILIVRLGKTQVVGEVAQIVFREWHTCIWGPSTVDPMLNPIVTGTFLYCFNCKISDWLSTSNVTSYFVISFSFFSAFCLKFYVWVSCVSDFVSSGKLLYTHGYST